jgi:hypothetical protein
MIMTRRKKILSGIFALIIGCSVALPLRASADDRDLGRDPKIVRVDWQHDRDLRAHDYRNHDRDWRWDRYQDHYRAYPYAPGYAYGRGYNPSNGAGMIDPRNPNLFWACDSDGHHCHWAPRY